MFDPFDTLGPVWAADPVVRPHPLNHGRTLWLLAVPPLDGGATWPDLMGRYPGTFDHMTTSASGWRGTTRPGGMGHVLLDGSDDAVTCPIQVAVPLTVAAWIAPASLATTQTVFSAISPAGVLEFRVNSSSGTMELLKGNTSSIGASTGTVSAGVWSRVAATIDGSGNWVIYINGLVAGSGSGAPSLTPAALLLGHRGALGGGSSYYPGPLDDVSAWSRVLPAAEAKADHDLSRLGYPGVLWRRSGMRAATMAPAGGGAWWLVDGGAGNPLVGGGLVR